MERPLTKDIKPDGQPLSIEEYEHCGGYLALRKALTSMTPEAVLDEVKASNLRGRGGAGFPTGRNGASYPGKTGRPVPGISYPIPTRWSRARSRTGSSWRETHTSSSKG